MIAIISITANQTNCEPGNPCKIGEPHNEKQNSRNNSDNIQ